MRGRKNGNTTIRNAPKHQKTHRRRSVDDDSGWEDLVESAAAAAGRGRRGVPAAITKTFRVEGLVALPSATKAACVAACVFYAFGSALLFCIATLACYCVLMLCSPPPPPASATTDSDDEMLECVTLAHLEKRLRHRTLRLDDCIHYVLFKIMRLVEAINTLRRSMLDYSFTVSIAQSSASHDLLELVDAAENDKQMQQLYQQHQQQLSRAASALQRKQQKKLKKKQARVKTIYSGQITVEEFTYLPEKQELKFEKTEEIPVLKQVETAAASSAQVAHDLKQDTAVVLEQLKTEELLPKVRASVQQKASVTATDSQTPKPAVSINSVSIDSVSKPVEKKKKQNSKPALRIETVETPTTDVQTVMQLAQVTKPQPVLNSPVVEKQQVVQEQTQQLQQQPEAEMMTPVVPVLVASDVIGEQEAPSEEAAEKPKRRRSSRVRRSRTRRSTLSITERPSSFYEEFLLLEPMIVQPSTPTVADKNQEMYTTEALKVRALQQTQLPIETKAMANPEIRIMVDEVNHMVSGMHALLAKNWEFLASLSEELAASAEKEQEAQKKLSALKDERAAQMSDEDELLECEEEPEFEDERFGDLEYDDHYYAYHAMSTPCL